VAGGGEGGGVDTLCCLPRRMLGVHEGLSSPCAADLKGTLLDVNGQAGSNVDAQGWRQKQSQGSRGRGGGHRRGQGCGQGAGGGVRG
jgi:hypothetical protein